MLNPKLPKMVVFAKILHTTLALLCCIVPHSLSGDTPASTTGLQLVQWHDLAPFAAHNYSPPLEPVVRLAAETRFVHAPASTDVHVCGVVYNAVAISALWEVEDKRFVITAKGLADATRYVEMNVEAVRISKAWIAKGGMDPQALALCRRAPQYALFVDAGVSSLAVGLSLLESSQVCLRLRLSTCTYFWRLGLRWQPAI